MHKKEIAKVLKDLRIAANMKRQGVADAMGVSVKTIGHWETGYAQPDANTLFQLCDLYGTTVDAAFGFEKKEMDFSERSAHITARMLAEPRLIDALEKYFRLTETQKQHVIQTIDVMSAAE